MMRRVVVSAALLLAVTSGRGVFAQSCAPPDTTKEWYAAQRAWWQMESAHDWTDDTLRTALVDAARSLEAHRVTAFPIEMGAVLPVDAVAMDTSGAVTMRARLRDMAAKRTWPLRSMVGAAGVRAAWLIARGDSALSTAAMHRMMEGGPGEASEADVAVLEDALRIRNGRKQIYGSQLVRSADGKGFVSAPTEDIAHVDMRREAAGLPPLRAAICAVTGAVRRSP